MEQIQPYKWLIIVGLLLTAAGLMWWLLGDKLSFIGKLPGDFRIEREHFRFYFPLTSILILSAIINILLWVVRKFIL
jgi:hypothetical protein